MRNNWATSESLLPKAGKPFETASWDRGHWVTISPWHKGFTSERSGDNDTQDQLAAQLCPTVVLPFWFYLWFRQSLFYSNLPHATRQWLTQEMCCRHCLTLQDILMWDTNTFGYRGWLTHSTLKIVLGSSNPVPQPCAEKQPKFTLDWYLCCNSQDLEVYCTACGKTELSAKAPKQEPCPHKKPTSPDRNILTNTIYTERTRVILGVTSRHWVNQLIEAILFWWELNSVQSPLYQTPQPTFMTTGCWQMCSP